MQPEKKRVLITLPYSGRGIGGGLAVFNQELTTALAEICDVKLLTMALPEKFTARREDHGKADIVYVKNPKAAEVTGPGGGDERGGSERDLLYRLLLEDVTNAPHSTTLGLPDGWMPDIIIGHSRFSGPAAIMLKQRWYPKAKVVYFLHSVPIEGTVLKGDAGTEERKIAEEMRNMPGADIVAGVGPLLREAAQRLAVAGAIDALKAPPRIYELVPGLQTGDAVQPEEPEGTLDLLLLGRAEAGIKGFADAVNAVRVIQSNYLRAGQKGLRVRLKIRGITNTPVTVRGEESTLPDLTQEWVEFMQDMIEEERRSLPELMGTTPKPSDPSGSSPERSWVQVMPTTSDADVKNADIRASHALLMPSHFEHFGLVWLEAASFGIPVLVNEYSGGAFFLADEDRMGKYGAPSVVADGRRAGDRPAVWADAIALLYLEYGTRVENAKHIREVLTRFTWPNAAKALVDAVSRPEHYLIQGPGGSLLVHSGQLPDRDLT